MHTPIASPIDYLSDDDRKEIGSLFRHNARTYGYDLRKLREQPWDHSERPSITVNSDN